MCERHIFKSVGIYSAREAEKLARTSHEDRPEYREVLDAINKFLHKTNSRGRKIFLRRYWLCESVPELAKHFMTTENTISVSLSRTRSELVKYLKKRGFEIE